jgi:hypothetical protein
MPPAVAWTVAQAAKLARPNVRSTPGVGQHPCRACTHATAASSPGHAHAHASSRLPRGTGNLAAGAEATGLLHAACAKQRQTAPQGPAPARVLHDGPAHSVDPVLLLLEGGGAGGAARSAAGTARWGQAQPSAGRQGRQAQPRRRQQQAVCSCTAPELPVMCMQLIHDHSSARCHHDGRYAAGCRWHEAPTAVLTAECTSCLQ